MNNQQHLSLQSNEPSKDELLHVIALNSVQMSHLTSENNALRRRNNELEKDKESYRDSMEKYKEIIEENKKLIKDHENNIEKLKKENIELNNRVILLEGQINDQNQKIALLEKDVQNLKNRDEPITVREGFVSLEKHIMIEILGSKRKARSFYGVKDLFSSKQHETGCNNFLLRYGITVDHINLISDIKEHGNKSAHQKRPTILKTEFENITLSCLIDNDDKDMAKDLLNYLELKNPYDKITGLWEIKKPY